jgi:peptide/nickel transport system permease protein
MSESVSEASAAPVQAATPLAGMAGSPVVRRRRRGDFLYYGLRNKKLVFGLGLELLLALFAIIGPIIAKYSPQDFTGAQLAHPGAKYWLGTDYLGHDVFSQLASGLRESYFVGAIGAVSASVVGMVLGFTAGWRGGILDEVLQMITNIIVMIPALVLLVVIGSYLNSRSVLFEGVFIGLTTWPWVARAVRAQTFSLRSRDGQALRQATGGDRRQGHRAQHGLVPVPRRRPAFRQLDAACRELRLSRPRPDRCRLPRLDDEPGDE